MSTMPRMSHVYGLGRLAVYVAVPLMAAWNAYICLRLRPDLPTVVINLAFWFVPILVPFALTGHWWRSVSIGTTVTFLFQRLHWLKWRYLEQTWTAADFRLLVDPANWIVLRQYPQALLFVVLGFAVLGAAWLFAAPGRRAGATARGLSAVLGLMLAVSVVHWRHAHPFDPFGFSTYGHFASLAYSASTLVYNPPVIEGTSDEFLARARALPPASSRPPARPPDIVIWLQESTMDLALLDVPGLPSLAMYAPDRARRAGGLLRVHTWGGNTWLSEFALLAGLASADFGDSSNGVYYTVTPKLRYSLPRLLKRSGYRAIALSGSPKGLYNMETAQRDLGFDEVLNPLDFPQWNNKSLADHLISDSELGAYALEVLARPRDHPILLFVLSIMQHGPYNANQPVARTLDQSRLGRAMAGRLSDFSDRMVATDRATRDFGATLMSSEQPVVFAYFGDHQPNLGGTVPFVPGLVEPHLLTSYAVTSNFDAGVTDPMPALLDIVFLGGVILQHAATPLDALFGANRAMRLLCHGRLADCPDAGLVRSYRAHLYDDLDAAEPRVRPAAATP